MKWKKSNAKEQSVRYSKRILLIRVTCRYTGSVCSADLNYSTQKIANFFHLAVCKFARKTRIFSAPGASSTVARTPCVDTNFDRHVGIHLYSITVSKLRDFTI
jgi:hypothetical protein